MTTAADRDVLIRLNAFRFLDEQRLLYGGDIPWAALDGGFRFQGERVPLIGPQGIFKPKVLSRPIPISIATTPPRPGRPAPYEDRQDPDGLLHYKYRGEDPSHYQNEGLRIAMREQIPLIYFIGIAKGWYSAAYPAYIVKDDPASLSVTVAIDNKAAVGVFSDRVAEQATDVRRAYATQLTRRRIHQDQFRHSVLVAYRESCAICNLGHRQLLEAAHIIPDSDPRGEPVVRNGLSLCKLHHAAFDSYMVGITPELVIEVQQAVRKEKDGPMLVHGLQNYHGQRLLVVPRQEQNRPDKEFLAERYERFRQFG